MIKIEENVLDIQTYLNIRASVNWKKLSETQAKKALEHSLLTISAIQDGETVGMGRIVGDGAVICYIQDFIVCPDCQGKGIGQQMMKHLIAYINGLREENSEIMLCLMSAKGRETYYEQFGFVGRPTDKLGPGMIQYLK